MSLFVHCFRNDVFVHCFRNDVFVHCFRYLEGIWKLTVFAVLQQFCDWFPHKTVQIRQNSDELPRSSKTVGTQFCGFDHFVDGSCRVGDEESGVQGPGFRVLSWGLGFGAWSARYTARIWGLGTGLANERSLRVWV